MRGLRSKIEDYPAHLEACWQEHLKPREAAAPTVISLFAGCSGSSLGYSMAGYRELLAVEWDDHAEGTNNHHRRARGPVVLHPNAMTIPVTSGESLYGCSTPPDQLDRLQEASRKYRAYLHWSRIRLGSSEKPITGQGFNAVKFDPRKPAQTVRRNDGNLGMHGAMHNADTRIMPRRRTATCNFIRISRDSRLPKGRVHSA
ncbi:MAG: hypothetical protein LAP85_25100 [Acidobacteriia bacterium]|nr:hypothetical protein [Terriglobia bacterium]